ncbi:MAG: alpha-glucosidase [Bacilli bacterium]|nr:alpha-glucosidase [Bacilli bacterium]
MVQERKLWQDEAIYQIYPRSFCDSNGDGIGDIPGIISKLDYLKDLGVRILWLSPVYQSPLDDMGYDVADYRSIHPSLGTMEDMEKLIAEADKRGLKIVMDLVVNHTSDEHEWFLKSKDPTSPYHDYYIWRKGRKNNKKPPNNWTSMFVGSAWTYVPEVGEWYLHLYGEKQPDLNWHNPKVYEEVKSIVEFWLDKGIYGFRCDVINQIYKTSLEDGKGFMPSGRGMEHYLNQPGNHEILRRLHEEVFAKRGDSLMLGETFNVDFKNGHLFQDNKELDLFFVFDHMMIDKSYNPFQKPKFSVEKFMKTIYDWQENCPAMANYLENHDQRRSISRFGDEKEYRNQSGKMLALLNLTLAGTPFIYEGEELGMIDMPRQETHEEYQDVACKRIYSLMKKFVIFPTKYCETFINHLNRDHARLPVQWDETPNGGFCPEGVKPWLPVNPDYPSVNAKAEVADPDSIFSYYKALLHYRSASEILRKGSFSKMELKAPMYAFFRELEGKKTLTFLNFSKEEAPLPEAISSLQGKLLFSNYGRGELSEVKTCSPFEAFLLELD